MTGQVRGSCRLADDGEGACGNRLRHEAHAVHLRARHGEEQGALLDLAAVGCDLRNGKRGLLPAPRFDDQIAEMLGGLAHRLLPQAPRRDISGKGCAGGSKRGGTPSSGATRSITLPVTGPAFQPAVEKP